MNGLEGVGKIDIQRILIESALTDVGGILKRVSCTWEVALFAQGIRELPIFLRLFLQERDAFWKKSQTCIHGLERSLRSSGRVLFISFRHVSAVEPSQRLGEVHEAVRLGRRFRDALADLIGAEISLDG